MVSLGAQAADDAWTQFGKVSSFTVSDNYADIVRVIFIDRTYTNPAECENIELYYIDIEVNKNNRTRSEFEQMMTLIYMSITTDRNVRFSLDGERCTPDGSSLAIGVEINNP